MRPALMPIPAMIDILSSEELAIQEGNHVIYLTSHIRNQASEVGMSLLDQTKLSTAASELARNLLVHGGGGNVQVECIRNNSKTGIRLIFTDQGPGIANTQQALQAGYSTGSGMGLGLPGAKQLSDEFYLTSVVGEGTTITIVKWVND